MSDTKRVFYSTHTSPINSIYRRVVDELMVEMHLLTVNRNFVYSPIYALGMVTTFDCFMQGYQPASDVQSIFNALCLSIEGDPAKYRQDAENLKSSLSHVSFEQLTQTDVSGMVGDVFQAITNAEHFQYTRLFGIGLYTLLATIEAKAIEDKERCQSTLEQLATTLNLSYEQINKDIELYRSNLKKMQQAQQAIADTIAAGRKQREQREQTKDGKA